MNYPNWAPEALVNWHKLLLKEPSITLSPDGRVDQLRQKPECSHFSDEDWEFVRRNLNRTVSMPESEQTELLGRLLTSADMEKAWRSLARWKKSDEYSFNFWMACTSAIQGWRGSQKLTAGERQQSLAGLAERAKELRRMLMVSDDFRYYRTGDLIDDRAIKMLIDELDVKPTEKMDLESSDELSAYVHFMVVDSVVPTVWEILGDIESRSTELLNKEVLVKKPKSERAPIHYFIRWLSQYIRREYRTPLHDVVAATASVVFDDRKIDSDYVRKILKP